MRELLNFPKGFKTLCILFFIEQFCYGLYWMRAFNIPENANTWWTDFFFSHFFFITGVTFVLAGWIVDRIKNVRLLFLNSGALMLLGHLMVYFSIPEIYFLGNLMTSFFACIIFVGIFKQTALLFSKISIKKEAGFLILFFFINFILCIRFMFEKFLIRLDFMGIEILVVLIGYIAFLIFSSKILLKKPTLRKNIPKNSVMLWVGVGFVGIAAMAWFATSIIQETISYQLNSSSEQWLDYYNQIEIGVSIFWGIVIILFLKSSEKIHLLFWRLIFGVTLMAVGFLAFHFIDFSNWNSTFLLASVIFAIESIFVLTPALTILTHNYFTKNTGLWLGIVFGIPYVFPFLIGRLPGYDFIYKNALLIIGIVLFVIAILIYENSNFLIEKLRLNESNEIETPEETNSSSDPFEHLIEE